jgi:glycosyltransferase involved in cell wall biosynthesis
MNDIITKNKDFKLVIIAPKTTHLYAQHIQQQIQLTKNHITDNQLNNHIIWIDPVPDDETLRLWMASADIGIVPSMSE